MTTTTAVPSSDVSDFLFNVQKLDEIATGSALTYTDRLGQQRSTAAGVMARFAALNPRGVWATATVYQPRDLVLESGTWYIALDTHTSGATFAGDLAAHWRPEQGVTRADLASTASAADGAGMIGRAGQVVSSIAALRGLPKTSPSIDAFVTGYYAAYDGGGGPYRYDSTDTTTADNGGTVVVAADGGRWKLIHNGTIDVRQCGAKGDGVADDTASLQAAFDLMVSYRIRSLRWSPGTYNVSATLNAVTGLQSAEFIGHSGYDGTSSPTNDNARTVIKWVGASSDSTPVVAFDRASGCVWRGISINCNRLAGYGLQFYSSTTTDGFVKNTVEMCSISRSRRDGILIGTEGVPTASPGQRQAFAQYFRQITFHACKRSAIHINEWNADICEFDGVWVFFDDVDPTWKTEVGIWFEHGGQCAQLDSCQFGGLDIVVGVPGSGYAIKNGPDSGAAGAMGLMVNNLWQEGAGGMYWGQPTGLNDKPFVFTNCKAFTSGAVPSVYIDKASSDPAKYVFIGCHLAKDIQIVSSTFRPQDLTLINSSFGAGAGVIDANGVLVIDGAYTLVGPGSSITIPTFATLARYTLDANVTVVFAPMATSTTKEITIVLTQDATGGRTVTWGSAFASLPAIPAPTAAAGARTVYTFISNGTNLTLKSVMV